MPTPKTKVKTVTRKFSEVAVGPLTEHGNAVIQSARVAALALARFWDDLRRLELLAGVAFEGTLDVLNSLASATGPEPNLRDAGISKESAVKVLDECLTVEGYL